MTADQIDFVLLLNPHYKAVAGCFLGLPVGQAVKRRVDGAAKVKRASLSGIAGMVRSIGPKKGALRSLFGNFQACCV